MVCCFSEYLKVADYGRASDYSKIVDTKDSKQFIVQRTEISIFMAVMSKQGVVLYEWAKEPYLKFMKVKAFWLPEPPKFAQLLHDGLTIREVLVAYNSEANIISVHDSQVHDLITHVDFQNKADSKARWQTFDQIPFSEIKKSEMKAGYKPNSTVNRKLAAVVGSSTLERSPTDVIRYFLGTYSKFTRIVDIHGHPVGGAGVGGWKDGVYWKGTPLQFILRSGEYVVSVSKHRIEVVDWKSAQYHEYLELDDSCQIRLLSTRRGFVIAAIEKKKKGCQVVWIKENPKKSVDVVAVTTQMSEATVSTSGSNGVPLTASTAVNPIGNVVQPPRPNPVMNGQHSSGSLSQMFPTSGTFDQQAISTTSSLQFWSPSKSPNVASPAMSQNAINSSPASSSPSSIPQTYVVQALNAANATSSLAQSYVPNSHSQIELTNSASMKDDASSRKPSHGVIPEFQVVNTTTDRVPPVPQIPHTYYVSQPIPGQQGLPPMPPAPVGQVFVPVYQPGPQPGVQGASVQNFGAYTAPPAAIPVFYYPNVPPQTNGSRPGSQVGSRPSSTANSRPGSVTRKE